MKHLVNWDLFKQAELYYKNRGFDFINVPICVSFESSQATKPPGVPERFHRGMDVYVASAEQSFIEMVTKGKLTKGKYSAITPCMRSESQLDDTHYEMFMKMELIVVDSSHGDFELVLDSATEFFNSVLNPIGGKVHWEPQEDGSIDIVCSTTGIELGSYGVRTMPNTNIKYVYGTGIAEPRTSTVMGIISGTDKYIYE